MNFKSVGMLVIMLIAYPSLFLFSQTSYLEEEQLIEGASFHENVEVRSAMADAINAPFYSLLTRQKEIHSQILSPVAVEFELRKSEDSFYLLFKNELDYKYPVWGRGNYIIKRDLKTGEFLQIKIFLQNDEMSYIRLFPFGENRTSLELSLYGVTLYNGIVLPVALQDLAVTSFTRIMSLTKSTIRWEQIFTDASYQEWQTVSVLAQKVSKDLEFLFENEDGALNRDGHFALIESGVLTEVSGGVNCSGFAKWVADGMLLGRGASGLLSIDPLKNPSDDIEMRESHPWSGVREDRDPYFGLDWCRNLSVVLRESEPGGQVMSVKDMDVRTVPFFEYKNNIGYELDKLVSVLYLQAVKEPGNIYFGAVNSMFGKDPVLWQYHHVALFFPWFDSNGDFHLEVMETGDSSSIENLKYRYPQSFVHLSKVKATDSFESPWQLLDISDERRSGTD